jgi:hypothetical protein
MVLDIIWFLSVSMIFMELMIVLLAIANTLDARPKKKGNKEKSTRTKSLS